MEIKSHSASIKGLVYGRLTNRMQVLIGMKAKLLNPSNSGSLDHEPVLKGSGLNHSNPTHDAGRSYTKPHYDHFPPSPTQQATQPGGGNNS
jgi:hypothetical protein